MHKKLILPVIASYICSSFSLICAQNQHAVDDHKSKFDSSFGKCASEVRNGSCFFRFDKPFTGFEYVLDDAGGIKLIKPVEDEKVIISKFLSVAYDGVADDKINLDDCWIIHKTYIGKSRDSVMGFINIMANLQVSRNEMQGYPVRDGSVFVADYISIMKVDDGKFRSAFLTPKKNERGLVFDARKLFLSW